MPEQILQRRVAPQVGAAMPTANPDAYGAQVGRALEQVGNTVQQERLQDYAIERRLTADEQAVTFQKEFALAREDADEAARTARQSAAAGGRGHADAMAVFWEEKREALLSGITEDAVRQRAGAQFEEVGARFRSGEEAWEDGARAERTVTDYAEARDIGANRVRRLSSPADLTEELKLQFDVIDDLQLNEDGKEKLRDETEAMYNVAFLKGRIDDDPAVAKALLVNGVYDEILSPREIEGLERDADIGIRSAEVAEARRQAAAVAEAKEEINALLELNRQGVAIPEDQLATARDIALATGDKSLAVKIEGLVADNAFARVYEGATPLQREQRMTQLAGKGKRSPNEDRELKWLQDKSGALDSAFESDPVRALGSQTGAPAIDLSNPATLQARSKWAATQSRATGRYVPPLSRAEVAPLRDLYGKGNAARREAFDTMDSFAPRDRYEVARMVAPNDTVFQELATVPKQFRDMAIEGLEALKGNKALLKVDDLNYERDIEARDSEFAFATKSLDSDQRNAVQRIARGIAAARVADGAEMTPQLMYISYQRALGARGEGNAQRGGMKRWTGTDRWFLLPEGITAKQFTWRITNSVKANPNVAPRNPDGSIVNLNKLTPVLVEDGWYEFHSRSGTPARVKDGRIYRVRP